MRDGTSQRLEQRLWDVFNPPSLLRRCYFGAVERAVGRNLERHVQPATEPQCRSVCPCVKLGTFPGTIQDVSKVPTTRFGSTAGSPDHAPSSQSPDTRLTHSPTRNVESQRSIPRLETRRPTRATTRGFRLFRSDWDARWCFF